MIQPLEDTVRDTGFTPCLYVRGCVGRGSVGVEIEDDDFFCFVGRGFPLALAHRIKSDLR